MNMQSVSCAALAILCLRLFLGIDAARATDHHVIDISRSVNNGSRITALPGLTEKFSSAHYGGYITVDAKHNRQLYYYFVESENDPANDPVGLLPCMHAHSDFERSSIRHLAGSAVV
jgi:Serine carboxypeptidase